MVVSPSVCHRVARWVTVHRRSGTVTADPHRESRARAGAFAEHAAGEHQGHQPDEQRRAVIMRERAATRGSRWRGRSTGRTTTSLPAPPAFAHLAKDVEEHRAEDRDEELGAQVFLRRVEAIGPGRHGEQREDVADDVEGRPATAGATGPSSRRSGSCRSRRARSARRSCRAAGTAWRTLRRRRRSRAPATRWRSASHATSPVIPTISVKASGRPIRW